jgi:hypothetical protein
MVTVEFAAIMDDGLGDQNAEPGHAVAEPFRYPSAMQG